MILMVAFNIFKTSLEIVMYILVIKCAIKYLKKYD